MMGSVQIFLPPPPPPRDWQRVHLTLINACNPHANPHKFPVPQATLYVPIGHFEYEKHKSTDLTTSFALFLNQL